ncbi:Transglutaminase-like enzyme [Labilithrix luteola]|uniref:Transglutaminase-like enzyme n=1 Tax=Labilithrix luteola TaxID=1391654 RepID=A0A0K1Q0I4_9BACT|nr:DUF3857 domain-containing transglutaminase family protein [Labilithrix luteola]AKU99151.1 Transglutaminase-like enzyme [Labilithrix luteola]
MLLALVIEASLLPTAIAAPREYATAPTPSWVTPSSPSSGAPRAETPASTSSSEAGIADLVIDDQLRVGRTAEHYIRRVRKVTSPAGVRSAAEFELLYDPAYERVTLHHVVVLRGDERIDATKTATVRVIESESSRDEQIYDGTRTIVFLLADVRVGDVVEFEATVAGENPVFGGRTNRRWRLDSSRPTAYRRARIVYPSSRPLAFRLSRTAVPTTSREVGADTEVTWEAHDLPAVVFDDDAPPWFTPTIGLSLSEFTSWADVARWASTLYSFDVPTNGPLFAKIREISSAHATAEARALAALRFVQTEVRYLGMELGEHSHRPHAPASVFAQRFGDCKDKTSLLVAMLRAMGIEAQPALVNPDLEAHLDEELPSPFAFNHVIARLRVDGREIWVDPTNSFERGPLGREPVRYGRALVASPEETGLVRIDAQPVTEPTTTVHETFNVSGESATLDVVTRHTGEDATGVRRTLANRTRDALERSNVEFYAKAFPTVAVRSPFVVEDDEATNVVVVREFYAIPHVYDKNGRFDVWAHSIQTLVGRPQTTRRSSPLSLAYPLFVRHEIEVEGVELRPLDDSTVNDGSIVFTRHSEKLPKGLLLTFELRALTDAVPPEKVAEHVAARSKIQDAVDWFVVPKIGEPVKENPAHSAVSIAVDVVLIVGLLIVGAVVLVRRTRRAGRRWRWRWRRARSAGEVPARAIRVASRHDAERRVFDGKWECGHAPPQGTSQVAWASIAFGAVRVTSARALCPSCGQARVRYFELLRDDDTPRDDRAGS